MIIIYRTHCHFVVSRRSCFELLLSVPENEIPFEAWVQFHHSVQVQHCIFFKLLEDLGLILHDMAISKILDDMYSHITRSDIYHLYYIALHQRMRFWIMSSFVTKNADCLTDFILHFFFLWIYCSSPMIRYYSMAAQTSRHYCRSLEREEPGVTLSLLHSSLGNPPTQKKVRV